MTDKQYITIAEKTYFSTKEELKKIYESCNYSLKFSCDNFTRGGLKAKVTSNHKSTFERLQALKQLNNKLKEVKTL